MAAAGPLVPDVRRIAVLRATALGDLIMVLPALEALRRAYPDAEIVLLARDWHAAYLRDRPGPVDRVIEIPEGAVGDELGDWDREAIRREFFASIAHERFDLALQMHGGGRNSNPFLRRFGARVTAGLSTPDAPDLDRSVRYVYYQAEVIRYLEVAALVGADRGPAEPRLSVTAEDLEEAAAALARLAAEAPVAGGPIVILHPGATDTRRRWPAEGFAEVGRALVARGAAVGVTGARDEADLTSGVAASIGDGAVDLYGSLSLRGLTGLLSAATLVISNDTGPRHVAAAVGTPTVSVYWSGNLITAGPLTRSRHRPLIGWTVLCPSCGIDCTRGSCEHRDSFVADVPVADVLDAALDLLATDPPRQPTAIAPRPA